MSQSNNNKMPCAACKFLRRRCSSDCIFLPYFPPTDPQKFVVVHRIFGASNVSKMLREILTSDREDAVTSMVYEAKARIADPVYGCVGLIASLQTQVSSLQSELNTAIAETMALRAQLSEASHHQFCGHNSLLSSPVMDYIHLDAFASDGLLRGAFPTFNTE